MPLRLPSDHADQPFPGAAPVADTVRFLVPLDAEVLERLAEPTRLPRVRGRYRFIGRRWPCYNLTVRDVTALFGVQNRVQLSYLVQNRAPRAEERASS